MTDLSKLKELLGKATPGKWACGAGRGKAALVTDGNMQHLISHPVKEADAALIVAAVNALPELIAEVEGLRAKLNSAIDDLRSSGCWACENADVKDCEEPCRTCFEDTGDATDDRWKWRGETEATV